MKTEQHNIVPETRSKILMHRSKTKKLIAKYVYEQTGCEKCRRRDWCSRDGDKWTCCSYQSIADHLNDVEGHPTSRGNKWFNKTVMRQITDGMKVVSPEIKASVIQMRDKVRQETTLFQDPIEDDRDHETAIESIQEIGTRTYVANDLQGQDLDQALEQIRSFVDDCFKNGNKVSVVVIETGEE
ncbi:hypothetical protein OAN00_03680 [Pseudomonadales bacterium]|jgi:hypothetical protein|nr:hypothetical protein [Pseudomonadales bacterium]